MKKKEISTNCVLCVVEKIVLNAANKKKHCTFSLLHFFSLLNMSMSKTQQLKRRSYIFHSSATKFLHTLIIIKHEVGKTELRLMLNAQCSAILMQTKCIHETIRYILSCQHCKYLQLFLLFFAKLFLHTHFIQRFVTFLERKKNVLRHMQTHKLNLNR